MSATEALESVKIPLRPKKILSVVNLRDTEQGILNYMLLSNANFLEIKNKLLEDDFTFLIHKLIFKYLLILEEMFLADRFYGLTDLESILEIFAETLKERHDVKLTSTLDILSQTPSVYIDSDLEIINMNSMEKEIAIHNNKFQKSGTIETKDGLTWFNFINDRLIDIGTTNIAQLPDELHDNFGDILNSLSLLDLENGENELSMTFYGDPEDPDSIKSFYLKKDLPELKWFDDICQWAEKYDLDEDTFPRDRYILQDLFRLDLSNNEINELPKEIGKLTGLRILIVDNNNIKEFPQEIYQLKNLGMLSCIENNISYISEDIINMQELLVFMACYNSISVLPNNFFKLLNLTGICLHGNKLTKLPSDIGNLSNLTSITISNNDIAELPYSLSKLEQLESIDMENTQISEIPIDFLKHKSLNKLVINDDLLPFIAENIRYLNIDTINLSTSHFQESSQIIRELNLKLDNKSWMEERDKKDNGCIQLFKYKDEIE